MTLRQSQEIHRKGFFLPTKKQLPLAVTDFSSPEVRVISSVGIIERVTPKHILAISFGVEKHKEPGATAASILMCSIDLR
jgi:hypothetical protein